MGKVFCDDCKLEVEEEKTVLTGQEIVCHDCARLDATNFDLSELLNETEERNINEWLH